VRSLTNWVVDITTAHGTLVFGVFALMAEYEAAEFRESGGGRVARWVMPDRCVHPFAGVRFPDTRQHPPGGR